MWDVLQVYCAGGPPLREQDVGSRASHPPTAGGLLREGSASYDRPAPQNDRGDVKIPKDKDSICSGGPAHDRTLCAST